MKSYSPWKMSIIVCSFGAALLLSPACKAQSEVAPDHFEGGDTEPWEKASRFAATEPAKAITKQVATPAHGAKSNSGAKLQVAAAHEPSTVTEPKVAAIQDKRKTSTQKSKKP